MHSPQPLPKKLKWLYTVISVIFIAYGLFAIINQSISSSGKGIFAAGWQLQGKSAIVLGSVITFAGIYMLVSTCVPSKKKSRRK